MRLERTAAAAVVPTRRARTKVEGGVGQRSRTRPGSTPARPADSSNSETAAAPSPAATGHQPGPTPTTSSPGAAADPPPSTTASCYAATTTDSSTKDTGPSPSPTTANQNSHPQTGSTRSASHSATTHSETESWTWPDTSQLTAAFRVAGQQGKSRRPIRAACSARRHPTALSPASRCRPPGPARRRAVR